MAGKWTDDELRASVSAYHRMAQLHAAGRPFKKKDIYRELAQKFGRAEGAFERRMQNISAVLDQQELSWIPGLTPASNVGKNVGQRILEMLGEVGLIDPMRSPILGETPEQAIEQLDAAALLNEDSFKNLPETARDAIVQVRRGQEIFRKRLLTLWGGACAVTGCTVSEAVIASHAKPWKSSTNAERLDKYNGLPLLATFDALFDAGLISFADDGQILISVDLDSKEQRKLGLMPGMKLRTVFEKNKPYLKWHRDAFQFS